MKVYFGSEQIFQYPRFWLLALAGFSLALNLSLIWKAGLANLLVTSLLFLIAISYNLKKKSIL